MKGRTILLVEDDRAIATVIQVALEGEGAELVAVETLAARDQALGTRAYDAIITDVILPDGNALHGLADVIATYGRVTPVIVLSAQNTLDTAVRASEAGAFDYLPKPFDLDELVETVKAAIRSRSRSGDTAASGLPSDGDDSPLIIGRAASMQDVYRTLARVAPTDLSVLVLGESGTGKELIAQAIHASSARRAGPFVAVNMAAIPRELIESELFGHEKGAFTGAHSRASGRFEQAEGGTLFLDEIGDMPIEAQTRLLRVLQSGDYSPVGSAQLRTANVRIVAATNQNLPTLVEEGRFREDLFYRLNVIPLHLPPLRERRSDIALLADHFLSRGAEAGLPRKHISDAAAAALQAYDWPGNVRELDNLMRRLALLTRDSEIGAADVQRLIGATAERASDLGPDGDLLTAGITGWLDGPDAHDAVQQHCLHARLIDRVEQQLFDHVLQQTGGNQLKAAEIMGINRNTLRLKRNRPPVT